MIIVFVDDLIFRSKIKSTAQALDMEVRFTGFKNYNELLNEEISVAVIDLNVKTSDIYSIIRELKLKKPNATLIGFYSHVDQDIRQKAEESGCDLVWPRSKFIDQLPVFLQSVSD